MQTIIARTNKPVIFKSPYHKKSIDLVRGDRMVPLPVFALGLLYCLRIMRDIGREAAGGMS